MKAKYLKKIGILFLCCSLCSCAGWFVEKPDFQLSGISLSLRSMTTLNGAITVTVNNPNFYDLTLKGIDYRIKLGDRSLAEGAFRESMKISGKAQTDVKIPVQAEFSNVGSVFKTYISGKDVSYEIEGTIHVKVLWTNLRIPFSRTGSLRI
jgi:LEA14-like dessication related protein